MRISFRTEASCFLEMPGLRIIIIVRSFAPGHACRHKKSRRRTCGGVSGFGCLAQPQTPTRRAGKVIPTGNIAGKLRSVQNHANEPTRPPFRVKPKRGPFATRKRLAQPQRLDCAASARLRVAGAFRDRHAAAEDSRGPAHHASRITLPHVPFPLAFPAVRGYVAVHGTDGAQPVVTTSQ